MTGLRFNVHQSRLDDLGCTIAQWIELRDFGLQMIANGDSKDTVPIRAFSHQRHNAIHRRHIAWEMSLWAWWTIWRESGRWSERGVGRGYMMCRYGDVGPYSPTNVFIGPGAENLSAAGKKLALPIGVSRRTCNPGAAKPYRAYCNVGGKQIHLGSFETVDAARAAYLSALNYDLTHQPRASA